jgi:hypothetical protein
MKNPACGCCHVGAIRPTLSRRYLHPNAKLEKIHRRGRDIHDPAGLSQMCTYVWLTSAPA